MKFFVEKRLAELGLNPFEAARNAGLERGYINDILQGKKRSIKGENMIKLANALKVSMRDFIVGTSESPPVREMLDWVDQNYKHLEDFDGAPPKHSEQLDFARTDRVLMPVFSTAMGGDRIVYIETDTISFIPAPGSLSGVNGSYAFVMYSDNMEPELEPGDKVLIHPKLPPSKNKTCIFSHTSAGHRAVVVARLIDITETHWHVQQWHPNADMALERDIWPVCQRVIGKLTI